MQGRELRLNKACGTIADFTFEELCDRVSTQSNLDQLTLSLFTVFFFNLIFPQLQVTQTLKLLKTQGKDLNSKGKNSPGKEQKMFPFGL